MLSRQTIVAAAIVALMLAGGVSVPSAPRR